jgi:hypothetical protein
MNMNFSKLIGAHVKIVCIFGEIKSPIYYEGDILEYDEGGKVVTIKDRFGKTVFLDTESIRQVVVIKE